MSNDKAMIAKPFVKWAGGKGSLLPQFEQYLPKTFNTYFEPFVGGGALFFSLQTQTAYINDINKTLVSVYKQIQDDVETIIKELKTLEAEYLLKDEAARQDFYYQMRDEYNRLSLGLPKAIRLLFLNRTCFNGLYRENNKGYFNVPFGRYKNPQICNAINLRAISVKLQSTVITSSSYIDATKAAKKGDFIYFDPPYQPLSQTSSFTAYHQTGFTAKNQTELCELYKELDARGCYVMLSNSSASLIKELFKDFRQETVYAGRNINAKAVQRGKVPELLVLNY